MKKRILALVAGLGLAAASTFATAADVVITTGTPGGSYHGVFGKNMAQLLSEKGFDVETLTSAGSVENINRVADGQAHLGFTQADAWAASGQSNLKVLGSLGQECIYVAARSVIDDEDDLQGKKIAVGAQGSGSAVSWDYMRQLEDDYVDTSTQYIGDFDAIAALTSGQVDAFLWVASPINLQTDYLKAVRQTDGIELINFNDYDVNNTLPSGKSVYSFEEIDISKGTFNDTEVETACTDLLVVANPNADSSLTRAIAKALVMDKNRIMGQ